MNTSIPRIDLLSINALALVCSLAMLAGWPGRICAAPVSPDPCLIVRLHAVAVRGEGRTSIAWQPPRGETLLKAQMARLQSKRPPDVVVWSRQANGKGAIRAIRLSADGWRVLAQSLDRPIYRLQVGDVIGDGLDEIVIGLWQRAKLDPSVKRRIYVYSLDVRDHRFRPLWRGSALSRPFRDFMLFREGKISNLASIETQEDDPEHDYISLYTWNGFGFHRKWDSPVKGSILGFGDTCDNPNVVRIVRILFGKKETIEISPNPQGGYRARAVH